MDASCRRSSGRADRIVAQTTHFTDFIASTVKTPDHPDAQQFNPNTMKDVKVGEPGAGITLIEPPAGELQRVGAASAIRSRRRRRATASDRPSRSRTTASA